MERHLSTYIHPGRTFLEQIIKPNKLKIGEVADLLQVSRLTVSKIVNEKSGISPNIALRIQEVFGGNADMWTRMQNKYDMAMALKEYNRNKPKLKKFERAI
ncbi:HigA family addiction module antitoxin [Mongoliitalea daihaiensis]|jgi:addiction module HigA family antidote|uniref:HigA family addiction module antitoxin n=1 Tax=Mongoliitalea daihaiensis TaxID=2782006 RepID=UPI001F4543BA|nr:HigA family addiction module antitoxin [Mongoliitalea daihaiensis]UJP66346.1 HigA family addiction module antidote protein [Mongoliitalea daihaiensis]